MTEVSRPVPPPPRLAFVILAHDQPAQAAELARALVMTGHQVTALVHYDVRAPAGEFDQLRTETAEEPRIRLVTPRIACRWGSFSLVEAPLNALAQIEAEGIEPDYVMLLSGACLPNRPIHALESFLAANGTRRTATDPSIGRRILMEILRD